VLLAGDPEDYERILRAFQDAHEPAIDSFVHYLTETLLEIRIVEFMCGEDPIGREGHGPRFSRAAGARLADVAEWEHGAVTPVVAELGPSGLDTLDTLSELDDKRVSKYCLRADHEAGALYVLPQRLPCSGIIRRKFAHRHPSHGRRNAGILRQQTSERLFFGAA